MTKPSFTQGGDIAADRARVMQASEIASHLAAGRSVAPETKIQAREALVESLWANTTMVGMALQGLGLVLVSSTEEEEQAELVGEFVSAGARAQTLMDDLADRALPQPLGQFLASEELAAMRDNLTQPLQERLALIGDMLTLEQESESSPSRPRPSRHDERPEELARTRRPSRIDIAGQNDETPSETGPDLGETTLRPADHGITEQSLGAAELGNATVPEEVRLNAALSRGSAAVPELVNLLLTSPSNREFPCTALIHLGRTAESARSVLNQMRQLESNPDLRSVAELIRSQVEGDRITSPDDSRSRRQAKEANVADGWLLRAINMCDCPTMLKAAVGREVLAIPLALKHLVAMRARRRG